MYYRHSSGRLILTSGVQAHAEQHNAFWLIDLIASYQADEEVQKEHFQLWTIRVYGGGVALLEMRPDSTKRPMISQRIGYTDYTDFMTDFFVVIDAEMGSALMLSDEY